jgi:uncharacterized damage-inducible protein DinB/uncharacterized membrane protein
MHLSPPLLLHICSAVVGLLSGYLAMFLRKGSGLHGAAGVTFTVSMISMTTSAAYVATFERPNMLNVVVSLFTFYLVTTSWWSARHKEGGTSLFDAVALVFALVVGFIGIATGVEAAGNPKGLKDGIPAGLYFFFGSMALLSSALDVRLLVRGGVTGPRRLLRHLLRMCFALLIATFSLYPGQGRLFPAELKQSGLLFIPHVVLLGSMIFWAVRMSRRKRAQSDSHQSKENTMRIPVQATVVRALLICLLLPAAAAMAQENPLTAHSKHIYAGLRGLLLSSAERMPEEHYTFKPTDAVRTYGQILGHVADSQYVVCSIVLGTKDPGLKIEQTKSSKAELIAALQEAFAYCDKAYQGMTDDGAAIETVKFMGHATPKLGALGINQAHTAEHYGNLVTYMRMKGVVPPTSDPELMRRQ